MVTKPSEMSTWQTQLIAECVHAAQLPKGLINIVHGRGDMVGSEIARHPMWQNFLHRLYGRGQEHRMG